ncbi:MAG: AtpZ/AtpI family protein [Armatimonadota bacterium]
MPDDPDENGGASTGQTGRNMALSSVGVTLAVSVGLGVYVGNWLDHRWGTAPWLTVVGLLLGSTAGFIELWRVIQETSETK